MNRGILTLSDALRTTVHFNNYLPLIIFDILDVPFANVFRALCNSIKQGEFCSMTDVNIYRVSLALSRRRDILYRYLICSIVCGKIYLNIVPAEILFARPVWQKYLGGARELMILDKCLRLSCYRTHRV